MVERVDNLQYTTDPEGTSLFLDGPAEFMVRQIADALKADARWAEIFGDSIDPYRRMDYQIRQLPALRLYNEAFDKAFDSWFIEGELYADMIYPASIRRKETQQIQDTLSSALLQQFRRPAFFNALVDAVPGLNELGKRFAANKALGFEWNDTVVPLTRITLNFRIDLREWDKYLEETGRTKDSPFEVVLGDFKKLSTTISALRDDLEQELEIKSDQTV